MHKISHKAVLVLCLLLLHRMHRTPVKLLDAKVKFNKKFKSLVKYAYEHSRKLTK